MKVKRFKNLWTMGLILCGAILVLFYVAKIFFPQFIVGVAEIPSIVAFGEYVDTNKWAYYIVVPLYSYISGYFLFCACCKTYKMNWKGNVVLVSSIVISLLIQKFLPNIYAPYNYVSLVAQPFIILCVNKQISKETFISVCVCFIVDVMSQALSMQIRDIVMMTTKINFATFNMLLIDGLIWRILLYLFFNNKNKKGG